MMLTLTDEINKANDRNSGLKWPWTERKREMREQYIH